MSRASLATPTNADAQSSAFEDTARALESLYVLVPWLEGKQVQVGDEENLLTGGVQDVNHFLGRRARGFLLLDVVAGSGTTVTAGVFRRVGDTNDENTLQLYSEANVDWFVVWVY